MRFTKVMMIAGLAVCASSTVFASGGTSIVAGIKNQESVNNTAANTNNSVSKASVQTSESTGTKGTGGDNGSGNPMCVPEPASMLAIGLGAGLLLIKRRRPNKAA